jgi:hypothetical protein
MMQKIYPSSYAPVAGISTNSKYKNGCLRYIVFKDDIPGPREDIHPIYQAIGTLGEEYMKAGLGELTAVEKPFKHYIEGEDFYISGRLDAMDDEFIYEFKTSISRNFYTNIIRKGEINPNHLGQLITYMCIEDYKKGKIICAYAHFDKKLTGLKFEKREFLVEIDEFNTIHVDGEEHGQVEEVLNFYANVIQAFKSTAMPPATIDDNACHFCPLKDLCEFSPKEKDAFRRIVKQLQVESENTREPKINIHDVRR